MVKKITEKQFEKNVLDLRNQIAVPVGDIDICFKYTPAQQEVFFNSQAKKRIIRKGRRLGFTRGASAFVVDSALKGRFKKILWGDTIHQNIRNYVERYFIPLLKKAPRSIWSWNVSEKILRINGAVCDFRSADNPENWEGFGYDLVILNEAGIILKNRYIWENAVAPMLLDNPESVAVIGGTPKGKGLFYELWMRGDSSEFNDWQSFAFSTYDNPHLSKKAINQLIHELGGTDNVVRQEIYGDFIDATSSELFEYSSLLDSMASQPLMKGADIWGVDVARQGDDQSVIAYRCGADIYKITRHDTPDLMVFADYIHTQYQNTEHKPQTIYIEINGLGAGLYDMCRRLKLPVVPADVARKATKEKILNMRAEMYQNLKKAVSAGAALPNDKRLLSELAAIEYEIGENGSFKLTPKDKIKKKIGYSPDSADACALTYFYQHPPEKFTIISAAVNTVREIMRGY